MSARWWEGRAFLIIACLLTALPLLGPTIPPLGDLPGHIGRYHIAAELAHAPDLQRHWSFHWAWIGNLGVDLIVAALAPLVGVEAAAKWVVAAIPPLTGAALLWLSRESGRRVSPAALAALPLAYGYAFIMGFVNFALASALAIAALALWIRLGRLERLGLRAIVFVPIALMLWTAHSFGWGMFGLFAFAAEVARLRENGRNWRGAVLKAALACLPLAPPAALTVFAGSSGAAPSYEWIAKFGWIAGLFRDRWKWFDVASAVALILFLYAAIRRSDWRIDPIAGAAGAVGVAAFVALPYRLAGGAYVDMRMLAPALAVLLVAVRPPALHERAVAIAATAFFAIRIGATTLSMVLAAQTQDKAIEAIDQLPRGAAVLVLAQENCATDWTSRRFGHVAGIAVARRDVFENSQWTLSGQQLLRSRHAAAAPYHADPSQLVYPIGCAYRPTDPATAIRDFDRGIFTHVWVIGFAPQPTLARDVTLAWSNGMSSIYRVRSDARLSRGTSGR